MLKSILGFLTVLVLVFAAERAESQECLSAFCVDPDAVFDDTLPVDGEITGPNGTNELIRPEDSELTDEARADLACGCPNDEFCVQGPNDGGYCSVETGSTADPNGYCNFGGEQVGEINGHSVCGNGGAYAIHIGLRWYELTPAEN